MGRHDEALPVAEESVRLMDGVPLLRARRTLRTHWRAQCHLVELLWRAGRYAEALQVGDDALMIVDLMVRFYPAYARPFRAELLAYLAQCHRQVDHLEDAAAAADKAVADYRELGEGYPAGTAWALVIRADQLTALGRHSEADAARREASEIYTSLADDDPDQYRESLFHVVRTRTDGLWDVGDRDAAVTLQFGFLPALRTFATADPDTYQPRLANSLAVFAARAGLVGREDALEYADQALAIARRLANDGTHDRLLACCLHNRAVVLKRIGLNTEAAGAAQEAVQVWRRLVETEPAIHETNLADSLALSGTMLYMLDRDEEAAGHLTEAAGILRHHADDPDDAERLADILHDLGVAHSADHRHREAMGESIEYRRRPLTRRNGQAHGHAADQVG
ncbi:tetratricopeptide repeat protein [Micromonospora palythoicola]|uniref:tetratricopeptide repeat protein n=1 Tax=Micromonospora palythoicola TaxID=3120507 RepID=UPI002FCE32E9